MSTLLRQQWARRIAAAKHDELADKVIGALTDDLRQPRYRGNANILTGQCYVATEAYYHLIGGPASGFTPMFIHHEGEPHWFLKNKSTGEIIDLTAGQFRTPVPYDQARGKGFLTREPSRRAQQVMDKVNGIAKAASGKTYLRIGEIPKGERSANYVTGRPENGVSVYPIGSDGRPFVPNDWDENDVADFHSRLVSSDRMYLVQGDEVGKGQGGEPLLKNVRIVGEYDPADHFDADDLDWWRGRYS